MVRLVAAGMDIFFPKLKYMTNIQKKAYTILTKHTSMDLNIFLSFFQMKKNFCKTAYIILFELID